MNSTYLTIDGKDCQVDQLSKVEERLEKGYSLSLSLNDSFFRSGVPNTFQEMYPKVWLEISKALFMSGVKRVNLPFSVIVAERASHKFKKVPVRTAKVLINEKHADPDSVSEKTLGGIKTKTAIFNISEGDFIQIQTKINSILKEEAYNVISIPGIGLCFKRYSFL